MLSFTGGLKVFVALEPVDLRKRFSGLEGLVSERLGEDLRQGALFVFTNRRHSRLKNPLLGWHGVVAVDQAAGEGNLFVAEGDGSTEGEGEARPRGAGHAHRWY
jgi:transposase